MIISLKIIIILIVWPNSKTVEDVWRLGRPLA